jgi:hypothetical protein
VTPAARWPDETSFTHCAATVALAAHTDLRVIQRMLGHSSVVTTTDTDTSVLPEVAHTAAQASAKVGRVGMRGGQPHEIVKVDEGATTRPEVPVTKPPWRGPVGEGSVDVSQE